MPQATQPLKFHKVKTRKTSGSLTGLEWGTVTLAGAILDRLLHSATVLNIQGRSYRLKELDAQLQDQTSTTTGSAEEQPVESSGGEAPPIEKI